MYIVVIVTLGLRVAIPVMSVQLLGSYANHRKKRPVTLRSGLCSWANGLATAPAASFP